MAFLQCIFYDGEPDHNHEKNICHNDCIDIASPKCILSDLLPNYLSKHGKSHKIFVTIYALIWFLPSVYYQVLIPEYLSGQSTSHNGSIERKSPQ